MSDRCGKLFKAIYEELIMYWEGDLQGWLPRAFSTLHLLCIFHLWLDLKESIRPVFRVGKGWAKEWSHFEHLFWKTSYQTSEDEADIALAAMSVCLEEWIVARSAVCQAIVEEMPGKRAGSKKQSIATCARGQMLRLSQEAVKRKWIRAHTWKLFSHGMCASQRGENAFRWFKEKQTGRKHWPLSDLLKMAFKMSAERQWNSDVQSAKDEAAVVARGRGSSLKLHRMFSGIVNGSVTEYAIDQVSSNSALVAATAYSVKNVSSEEHHHEGAVASTTAVYHVWVPNSQSPPIPHNGPLDTDLPVAWADPDDYCVPAGGGGIVREVTIHYDHVTRTWTAECSCLADKAHGFQCRHETGTFLKATGPEAEYRVHIDMFNPIFRTIFQVPTVGAAAGAVKKMKTVQVRLPLPSAA